MRVDLWRAPGVNEHDQFSTASSLTNPGGLHAWLEDRVRYCGRRTRHPFATGACGIVESAIAVFTGLPPATQRMRCKVPDCAAALCISKVPARHQSSCQRRLGGRSVSRTCSGADCARAIMLTGSFGSSGRGIYVTCRLSERRRVEEPPQHVAGDARDVVAIAVVRQG